MPDLSGLDVLARRSPRSDMPIVMLSADSDPEAIEQALAHGAVAYLTKPVSIERLLALLRQIGTHAATANAAMAKLPHPAAKAPAESSLSLICRIATPEQRRTYLESWQSELQQDSDALLAALRTHDRTAAAAHLHRLQNAFLVMGRGEAVSLCAQLREAIRADHGIEPALGALQAELQATTVMLRERLAEARPARPADAAASLRPA